MSRNYRPGQNERLVELALAQGNTITGAAPAVAVPTIARAKGKYRGVKNKTEEEFFAMLEAIVKRGDLHSAEYEGLTLRWPKQENDKSAMTYTPDFVAVRFNGSWYEQILIEVKGAHAWAKDVVKFRAARDRWQHLYSFEFWQKISGEWKETR